MAAVIYAAVLFFASPPGGIKGAILLALTALLLSRTAAGTAKPVPPA